METISRRHPEEKLTDVRSSEVETFLAAVKEEQARYLAFIRQACSSLGRHTGQLAQIAAMQSRLTQQFFDAQRSIMTRRADYDARVAAITSAADQHARDHVAVARAHVESGLVSALPLAHPAVASACAKQLHRDMTQWSASHEVAALGASVVRTMDEADALAVVIDAAFEQSESDGVSRQRQFGALLDDWWNAENREGRAMVDLAEARASVRVHVAQVEAAEVISAARRRIDECIEVEAIADGEAQVDEPHSALPGHSLPAQISAILDHAEAIDLDSLLGMLADSLDGSADSPIDGVVVQFGPPTGVAVELDPAVSTDVQMAAGEFGSADAFHDFWSADVAPAGPRRTFQWPKSSTPAITRPTLHDGR